MVTHVVWHLGRTIVGCRWSGKYICKTLCEKLLWNLWAKDDKISLYIWNRGSRATFFKLPGKITLEQGSLWQPVLLVFLAAHNPSHWASNLAQQDLPSCPSSSPCLCLCYPSMFGMEWIGCKGFQTMPQESPQKKNNSYVYRLQHVDRCNTSGQSK